MILLSLFSTILKSELVSLITRMMIGLADGRLVLSTHLPSEIDSKRTYLCNFFFFFRIAPVAKEKEANSIRIFKPCTQSVYRVSTSTHKFNVKVSYHINAKDCKQ